MSFFSFFVVVFLEKILQSDCITIVFIHVQQQTQDKTKQNKTKRFKV